MKKFAQRIGQFFSRLRGKPAVVTKNVNHTEPFELDRFRRKLNVCVPPKESVILYMYEKLKKHKHQQRIDFFVMMKMIRTEHGYKEVETSYGFQGNDVIDGYVHQTTEVRGIKEFPRGEIFDFLHLAQLDGWVCSGSAEYTIDDFVASVFERCTKFSDKPEINNLISYQYTLPFEDNPPKIEVVYPDPTVHDSPGTAPMLTIDFVRS